jgi:hypothetical protein
MPVTEQEVQAFKKQIGNLQTRSRGLTGATRTRVQALVDEHRRKINDLITHYPKDAKGIPAADVPRLSQQIKVEVDSMIDEAQRLIHEAQDQAWQLGVRAGQELADSLGMAGMAFAHSTDLLLIATNYTADLVRSIPKDILPQMNGIISRSALGRFSPYEAMQELDKLIGRGGASGVSFQSERIIRTEVQRTYSIALDEQLKMLVEKMPTTAKLKKEWVSGPNRAGRRETHQEMDGQQVPVDEPFTTPDGVKLMYPRDPGGPPEETIMCGCGWRIVPQSLVEAVTG